jgi:hypothetical protein
MCGSAFSSGTSLRGLNVEWAEAPPPLIGVRGKCQRDHACRLLTCGDYRDFVGVHARAVISFSRVYEPLPWREALWQLFSLSLSEPGPFRA